MGMLLLLGWALAPPLTAPLLLPAPLLLRGPRASLLPLGGSCNRRSKLSMLAKAAVKSACSSCTKALPVEGVLL
jgi:hypothetical protein